MKRAKPQRRNSRADGARRPSSTSPVLVQIEKPIYGGAFLARVDGKATFVPLALPGEELRVRIVEEKRGFATAEPEQIVTPASSRIDPRCPHFGTCGGCSYQHTGYETQLELKRQILRETLSRGGVGTVPDIEILSADPWQYRNRIRLAFDAAGRVGYRGRRSHQVVPISECPISAPSLVNAALTAAETLNTIRPGLKPAELSLFCNASESAMLAGISVEHFKRDAFDAFAAEWKARTPSVAGVELLQESRTGREPSAIARWGESSIRYSAAGFDYDVENGAFFQVNRWLVDGLVERVVGDSRGAVAWDLFAGVGLFARRLAQRFDEVIAVESAPTAARSLMRNVEGTRAQAVAADTLSFLNNYRSSARPELIVVDPPRAGLGEEITSLLKEIAAPSITYVSCDPSTLARDLKSLVTGGYSLASLTLVDLFPQTFHLETLVELRRC